jgi:hypothetical protein
LSSAAGGSLVLASVGFARLLVLLSMLDQQARKGK